jgi:adenosine deaminase
VPSVDQLIRAVPKAELHVHIEGTLEPELMFEIGRRNGVPLRFPDVEAVRRAYEFQNLQSFLDIYYEAARVLLHERDFFDLTHAYLERAARENVRHVEIFFDPQTHTARGVPFATVLGGIARALDRAGADLGISSRLILCFLRHLSAESAMETLEEALPHRDRIAAVGLDSSEVGHPPAKFAAVFERARRAGLRAVAHAGEEGPPEYVWQALDLLGVSRVDHGVRCLEDPALVRRLVADRIPLTVCPLSNVRLRVFPSLEDHNLRRLMAAGLRVTVNSDDPAYFGGYVTENLLAVRRTLGLTADEVRGLMREAFEASFLEPAAKRRLCDEVDAFAG